MSQPLQPPAEQPPPKQGMGVGKIVMIVLGVLTFGGMTMCGLCTAAVGVGANAIEAEQAEAKVQLEKDLAACASEGSYMWLQLADDLKKNEAKTVASWKGNCAKISGIVSSIQSGFDDKPYVVVGGGEKFSLQNLHCHPRDSNKALELTKGQKIVVWGIGGNEIAGSLVLKHCDW